MAAIVLTIPHVRRRSGSARLSNAPFSRAAPSAVSAVSHPALATPSNPVVSAELLVGDALRHLAKKRYELAELRLTEALRLVPNDRVARLWLLVAAARRSAAERRHEAARECYRSVLELDPSHQEARRALGPERRGILARWLGRC